MQFVVIFRTISIFENQTFLEDTQYNSELIEFSALPQYFYVTARTFEYDSKSF